ncbi:uncharacterized protein A4U43_C05F7880 [Asparagus officinalis]|uniref:Uncharacterized protein n=1 Tax=Asparagus officinalis TaxID=4686 RepID=A0A5P1EQ44_ASPOF|nr:uncharacterized protein A4U43_C05F7880 [Asparagus officinalis]
MAAPPPLVPSPGSRSPSSDAIRSSGSSSPSPSSSASSSQSEPVAPTISRDVASCHVIPGDPPAYLFWRIHKNLRNVLEIFEVFACREMPEKGLHIVFQDELSPFAFLCLNEFQSQAGETYCLYALTVSGVAYLLHLQRPFLYISGSNFPTNDVIEVTVQTPAQIAKITSAAATSGCLLTGRMDGSISCYQLGKLDPKAPGFMSEIRDDLGISRLWNLMSRGKPVGPVQDMVISEMFQTKLLFVVHSDGSLRIWDLCSNAKIFSYNTLVTGTMPSRLCVGEANYETSLISLAILHESASESTMEMITVYNIGFSIDDKVVFSSEPSTHSITLDQGKLIDMKISSRKIWILKEDASMLYDLLVSDCKMEHTGSYGLQEDFVADQLFQGSEHTLDDMIWTNDSISSLMKDRNAYFISSIFLRRLLQPGVYQSAALRATVLDYKKFLSDFEFQSLTTTGLKKEILTAIQSEGAATNPSSMVFYWKNFCNCFFRYWCQNNTPYGFLVDSSNEVIGLVRKSSFSLFRSLEGSEQLIYGASDELYDIKNSGLALPNIDVDSELFLGILRCMSNINHQLGRAASAMFYESLITSDISSDEIIFQLLKILETGFGSSLSTSLLSHVGVDVAREKKQVAHKSQRKFSVDMFLSLHALRARATNWAGVLDVIDRYLMYLSPQGTDERINSEGVCCINSFLLIQATSQIARVMFESTFDVLLLLSYLVDISGQVDMVQADVARIKIELIPKIQEILTHWLVIHFLGTTPTTPPTIEDFSSRLSSLHIGNKADRRSLEENLGSSDFTLACLLDLPSSNEGQRFMCSKSFPSPCEFISSVRKFCSSIIGGRSRDPISSSSTIGIASILLRHGQSDSLAVWRLHYYQWAMQIFEQHGMNEGACQFALAALVQVDDVLGLESGDNDECLPEAATTIRGRLWANVFKFSLDLKHYRDAYCAIISNPDEDSRSICLRRFVIVLCELGATKFLCDGKLPFVGMTERVEKELVWKAERSEIFAKPNSYKVLYAFEAYRNNWRKAASYMYRYSVRLKNEATLDHNHQISSALHERLHGLSIAINSLQLVDNAYAWIDSSCGDNSWSDQGSPKKRARHFQAVSSVGIPSDSESFRYNVDVEMLEKEYVLTSAEYLLVNGKSKISGKPTPQNLVDILIQESFYDMAFVVMLKFWKGSELKRELENAFVSISQQCCSKRPGPSLVGSNSKIGNFLLPFSEDEIYTDANIKSRSVAPMKGNAQWEMLELYLEKYKKLHPRLPVTVAETLLHTDPQIELPLWLVHMFKGARASTSWGMTGHEADPATLFRLYVDYNRHAEATNLLLEYLESFASLRPADVINRKRMSAIWFPYTAIERLWCQLEELQSTGHMVDQCDKLKRLLHGALLNHLKQVKVDSDDAVATAFRQEMQNENGSV